MHWNYISPFLIAWQYASYLRKIACFHCHLFTDKLLYRLWWNNLAILFSKAHKEKKNTLFPAHLWFQPLPLARKNSPSHLLQKERGKIYFRWCKKIRTEHYKKIKEYCGAEEEKFGPPEKIEDWKGHTRKKRGKPVSCSCCQKKAVPWTVPQLVYSWYSSHPHEKILRTWKKIWRFFESRYRIHSLLKVTISRKAKTYMEMLLICPKK